MSIDIENQDTSPAASSISNKFPRVKLVRYGKPRTSVWIVCMALSHSCPSLHPLGHVVAKSRLEPGRVPEKSNTNLSDQVG